MDYIFLYAAVALCLISIWVLRDLVLLRKTIRWYKSFRLEENTEDAYRFIICIPAYHEEDRIGDTIQYFTELNYLKDKYTIVVVTTAKEGVDLNNKTHVLANSKAKEVNKKHPGLVRVINSPNPLGVMAHQINYTAIQFKRELEAPDSYFCVYNADSRPHKDTLKAVSSTINGYKKRHQTSPRILQQSSLYRCEAYPAKFSSWITSGAAIHQSLWTLRHEIPYYLKQSSFVKKLSSDSGYIDIIRYSRVAHCVGHGLFIKGDHYLQTPLPDELLNEDLPYGLLQCCKREAIVPIPTLEVSLSPSRLVELYRQKSVWFNPFFEFYGYAKSVLRSNAHKNRFEVKFLTAQAYFALVVWLFHSLIWLSTLCVSAIIDSRLLGLWFALFLSYWIIPSLYYRAFINTTDLDVAMEKRAILFGGLYVLSHSVGPFWGVARWAKYALQGLKPAKPKTQNV